MKKIMLLLLCLLLVVGCSNNEDNKEKENKEESKLVGDYKEPKLEWCKIYNPNGFNTVTCVMSNPNKDVIDVSYDLVFLKNGQEVKKIEFLSNFNVSPKHNEVVWNNFEVPNPSDVDEVKLTNVVITKSTHTAIEAEVKYGQEIAGDSYISFKASEKPTLTTFTVFHYNDTNKNGKCDKDELYITETYSTVNKEDKIYFDRLKDNVEIFYNSYK